VGGGVERPVHPVENPARRGSLIAEVPRATAEDVDRAVRAAAQAFELWRRWPPQERGRMLLRIADDFEARIEDIPRTVASETGNAIRTQRRPEARFAIEILRYFGRGRPG
jgi:acyl-CoA reductase-like NAD-dependent aldehyde dehydrogenase